MGLISKRDNCDILPMFKFRMIPKRQANWIGTNFSNEFLDLLGRVHVMVACDLRKKQIGSRTGLNLCLSCSPLDCSKSGSASTHFIRSELWVVGALQTLRGNGQVHEAFHIVVLIHLDQKVITLGLDIDIQTSVSVLVDFHRSPLVALVNGLSDAKPLRIL